MDTIPPEFWQYPALAAVVLIAGWLINHFTKQMSAERESYSVYIEEERKSFEKVTNEFSQSSQRILESCEKNTEKMLKWMEDQDIRWRQTMETRDTMFVERIKGLENAIRDLKDGKSKNQ